MHTDFNEFAYNDDENTEEETRTITINREPPLPIAEHPPINQKPALYKLSYEQKAIVKKICAERKNMFLTGPGGVGKSQIIRYISQAFPGTCQICAMTGCAAVLLECGARTLHSWAGIGLGKGPIDKLIERVQFNLKARNAWKSVQLLIIDEVSMLSKYMLELLDTIGRKIRRQPLVPFGGIQVVLSGDFYQLPPVSTDNNSDEAKFCFESPIWRQLFPHPDQQQELTRIFRQTDPEFADILRSIRVGAITPEQVEFLSAKTQYRNPDLPYTVIFPLRRQAESLNQTEMDKIQQPLHQFQRTHISLVPKDILLKTHTEDQLKREWTYIAKNALCEELLELKVGAHVMLITNLYTAESTRKVPFLCNGAQGIVLEIFCPNGRILSQQSEIQQNQTIQYGKTWTINSYITVQFHNGVTQRICPNVWKSDTIEGIGICQFPLIPSWGLTVHKVQGTTLDYGELNLGSETFAAGQIYVSLSRMKKLSGTYISEFDPTKIKANPKVCEFYKTLNNSQENNHPDDDKGDITDNECPICFDELTNDTLFVQTCMHHICISCNRRILNMATPKCPVCRELR